MHLPAGPSATEQYSLRCGSGGCSARASRLADGRYHLPAIEPGPGGEHLVEPVHVQRLAELGHHLGLPLPLQRPRPQADPLAQALGRPGQQRRPFPVTLNERQLGERGQAQGHVAGAVGRQAQLQPFV